MMNGILSGSFFVNITTATVINPIMEEGGGRDVWEEVEEVEEEMEEEEVNVEEVNVEEVEEDEEDKMEEEEEEIEEIKWEDPQIIKLNDGFGNNPAIKEWNKSAYQSITQILIGNDCLQFLTRLELKQYPCLDILTIGTNCCTKEKGELLIVDCPSLRTILIGSKSCCLWVTLRLENCSNLESIETREDCFHDCGSLILSGKEWMWL